MTPVLEITDLRKAYGSTVALSGVDLRIEAGEICALLGPNGAGKSTLVSIVSGLLRPDTGSVMISGIDAVAQRDAVRSFLGVASQELAIYPTTSVRDNLTMFGQLAGLKRKLLTERIADAAERMDLTALLERQARHLSGGEKRRLHTAIALLGRPRLLLLDEPTAGVDVGTRAQMVESIRQLASEEGCAVCYSTHYLGEVEDLHASVAILDHGQIITRGPIDELVRNHARSAVELIFEGPPPSDLDVGGGLDVEVDGSTLRIYGDNPAKIAAEVLPRLEAGRDGLRAVEFVTPSLEAVFLGLTGRRWGAGDGGDAAEAPEPAGVSGGGSR